MRRLAGLMGVVMLAGCAKPLEVGSITEIKPHTGAKGVDVYEPKRAAGLAGTPEFAGDQLLEVRTYAYKDGSGQAEVAGATCSLSAADFSATMQTPAKVRVPLYRQQSSSLAVACEMAGYQKKLVTLTAIDATRANRYQSGANAGIIGFVAVTAADAMSDNSKNVWQYQPARIQLDPIEKPAPKS